MSCGPCYLYIFLSVICPRGERSFSCNGELVGAGKFIDYALCLYGRDGKFHYDQRYDKLYYEGEFDEITEEEFIKFKEKMDLLGEAERKVKMTLNTTKTDDQNSGEK